MKKIDCEGVGDNDGFFEIETRERSPVERGVMCEATGEATPVKELRRQIMSSMEPKNEREHWAARRIEELEKTLNDLLNDCINFDGGKLTDCFMEDASRVLKNT